MYFLLNFLAANIQKLKETTLERLARYAAYLFFDVLHWRRRLVLENLRTAFPKMADAEAVAVAREAYYHFALNVLEFFHARGPEVTQRCNFHGKEHLEQALAKGGGAYILCCHLGNWEVLGAAVNNHIRQVRVVVKKVGGDGTNRFVDEQRACIGMHTIKRRGRMDAVRAINSALKKNEVVGFVLDQSRPGEPRLPFFSKDAKTNTSLALMVQRFQAPIIPAYIKRTAVGQHEVCLMPEVQLHNSGNWETDIIENTKTFNKTLEQIICQVPQQYFWLHNRWK